MRKLIVVILFIMPLFAYSQETKTSVDSILTKVIESVNSLKEGKNKGIKPGIVNNLDSLKIIIDAMMIEIEDQASKIKELEDKTYISDFFSKETTDVFGYELVEIDKSKIPSYLQERYNLYMNVSRLNNKIKETNKTIDDLLAKNVQAEKRSSFIEDGTESYVNEMNELCDLIRQGGVKSLSQAQQDYFSELKSDFNKILDGIDNVGK